MRKYLLAGAALAVATAALPVMAKADEMKQVAPPATLTLGGRLFESVFIQSVSNQNPVQGGNATLASYNFQDYFRLYPAVDYTAPNGMHFGFISELRWGGNAGAGVINRAYLFVKSDKMGVFTMGGQAGAIKSMAVANDEASGTGGWDGEYGFFGNGYQWLLADAYGDGLEGIKYVTPSFAGVKVTLSWTPDSTAQVGAGRFVSSFNNAAIAGVPANSVRNRVEGMINYSGTFGSTGLNADIGGAVAAPMQAAGGWQNVTVFDAGLEATFSGLTVGGHVDTGKYAAAFLAQPAGVGNTTAVDAGIVYGFGAAQVGAQYYGYSIPITTAVKQTFSGGAIGASYKLNPGVTLFFDGLFGTKQQTAVNNVSFTGVGIGTYFQW